MIPEPWPTDAASAVALLATVVRDIDRRSHEDHEALLAAFLCAAWPNNALRIDGQRSPAPGRIVLGKYYRPV